MLDDLFLGNIELEYFAIPSEPVDMDLKLPKI